MYHNVGHADDMYVHTVCMYAYMYTRTRDTVGHILYYMTYIHTYIHTHTCMYIQGPEDSLGYSDVTIPPSSGGSQGNTYMHACIHIYMSLFLLPVAALKVT
jgi:hypothetical protein